MNRIERLLWEEANIKDIAKPKSRGSACAKIVSITFLVVVFALLASRPWPPSFPEARVQASAAKTAAAQSAAAAKSAANAKTSASQVAHDAVTAAERPAR